MVSIDGLLRDEQHPPTASAVVYKTEDKVIAKKYSEQRDRWVRIKKGKAGVDDAEVIQSAVNVGGVIFVKAGEYLLNQKINLVSNIRLIGEGRNKTKFRKTAAEAVLVGYDVENVTLANFYIDCNGYGGGDPTETYYASAIAFQCSGTKPLYNIHLKQIKTYNGIGAHIRFGSDSNDLENAYRNVVIEQVECHLNPYDGQSNPMLLIETGNTVVLRDCYVHEVANRSDGCIALGGKNIWAYNCVAEGGYEGFRVEKGHRDIDNINIIGGTVKNNRYGVLLYPNSRGVTIDGLTAYKNNIALYQDADHERIVIKNCKLYNGCISIPGNNVTNITIKDNTIVFSELESSELCGIGISADNPSFFKIIGNTIYDTRTPEFGKTMRWGIAVFGTTLNHAIIENNHIWNYTEKAIGTPYNGSIKFDNRNLGTATFSGDGSTTDFLIGDHGLAITDPNRIVVKVTPISPDAIAASPCVGYVDPNDNTKIRVKFANPPASGTDNVKITWEAEVVF